MAGTCERRNKMIIRKEKQKRASYLYRTAQPPTLATFRSWGNSAGAGRIRLAPGRQK